MISWFKYHKALWSLDRDETRLTKAYAKERAGKKLSHDEERKSIDSEQFEWTMIEDQRLSLKTDRLRERAQRYDLPLPPWDDEEAWGVSHTFGYRYLKPKAYADLRSAVRKEENERWQYWELRLKVLGPILVGLTGATGALIGLIATWRGAGP